MNVVEEDIPELNNNPPKFKKLLYPIPNNKNIQKPYFIMAAIGQRGSGKTYSIVKVLANQERWGFKDPIDGEKVGIRHILFSPTFKGNPIFDKWILLVLGGGISLGGVAAMIKKAKKKVDDSIGAAKEKIIGSGSNTTESKD